MKGRKERREVKTKRRKGKNEEKEDGAANVMQTMPPPGKKIGDNTLASLFAR